MPMKLDNILPDSRLRDSRKIVFVNGVPHVPIFCANCGADGGGVPEEHMTFAFYLCTPCTETYGHIAGTMAVPEEVFWERVKQEQLEKHGRFLTSDEVFRDLDEGTSALAKLAREAPKGR